MIIKPSVTSLLKKFNNRFELVIVTARRARQIAEGDKVLTDSTEESSVTLASHEIEEGMVTKC